MFETKTDSSTLQAVFMNDAKVIRKAAGDFFMPGSRENRER